MRSLWNSSGELPVRPAYYTHLGLNETAGRNCPVRSIRVPRRCHLPYRRLFSRMSWLIQFRDVSSQPTQDCRARIHYCLALVIQCFDEVSCITYSGIRAWEWFYSLRVYNTAADIKEVHSTLTNRRIENA